MKQSHLRMITRLIITLLFFLVLYCFLLLKPLWRPIINIICLGLLPFVISGFIAYLLHPITVKLESLGMKRIFAISLIYITFFGGLSYALYLGIPAFIKQLREFSYQFPALLEQYRDWITQLEQSTANFPKSIQEQIIDRINGLETWMNSLVGKSTKVIMKVVDLFVIIAVIPFISFYLLKDLDAVKKMAWYLTPKKWRDEGISFLTSVHESLGGYIRGQLLVCGIIGLLASISFGMIGLEYPIVLGLIVGITNVIPYFGPLIGAVPVLAIALLSSVKLAIIALVIILVLQFLEGNFLSPYIVGKSISMHPLFIIAALIVAGEAFGIIGMIVSVPILTIIKTAITHSRDYLIKIK